MTRFSLYTLGFLIMLAGILLGAWLLGVPPLWLIVIGLALSGVGIMSAVSRTRRIGR